MPGASVLAGFAGSGDQNNHVCHWKHLTQSCGWSAEGSTRDMGGGVALGNPPKKKDYTGLPCLCCRPHPPIPLSESPTPPAPPPPAFVAPVPSLSPAPDVDVRNAKGGVSPVPSPGRGGLATTAVPPPGLASAHGFPGGPSELRIKPFQCAGCGEFQRKSNSSDSSKTTDKLALKFLFLQTLNPFFCFLGSTSFFSHASLSSALHQLTDTVVILYTSLVRTVLLFCWIFQGCP